jgi:RimJ/RimL family protein N-acetyltransferase
MLLPTWPQLRAGDDIVLRRHRPEDLEPIYEMCLDPEMQRWTTAPAPYARADADAYLARVEATWDAGTRAQLAIEESGQYAGGAGLQFEEGAWAEVAYGLAPGARGHGVMTRALGTLLAWGFDELGLEGIRWRAEVGNLPPRRVAERCGFRIEGEVRGLVMHRGARQDGWIGSLLPGELTLRDRSR